MGVFTRPNENTCAKIQFFKKNFFFGRIFGKKRALKSLNPYKLSIPRERNETLFWHNTGMKNTTREHVFLTRPEYENTWTREHGNTIFQNTRTREHETREHEEITRTREHGKYENTRTREHGNTRTREHENTGTREHGNTETREHGNTRTRVNNSIFHGKLFFGRIFGKKRTKVIKSI